VASRQGALAPAVNAAAAWMTGRATVRLAGAFALSIFASAHAGPLLDRYTQAEVASPPGQMISVGRHRLHAVCVGSGSPVVILDAGIGGSALDCWNVQERVGERTRACSYDRAGYGWSERGAAPRDAATLDAELSRLLEALAPDAPVVLVGHSFGGLLAQHFARRHPGHVAALVLVDAMHPQQFRRFAAAGLDVPSRPDRGLVVGNRDLVTAGLPEALRPLAFELAKAEKVRVTVFNEMRGMEASAAAAGTGTLPPVPLVVIAHGAQPWARFAGMEDIWRALQEDLARQSPGGRLVVVPGAGHAVQADAPERVAQEIVDVVDGVRRRHADDVR